MSDNLEHDIAAPLTVPEEWLRRARLTWASAALVVGLIMLAFLAVTLWAEGLSARAFVDSGLWRAVLLAPAEVLYFLLIYPATTAARQAEVKAFRPLMDLGDDSFMSMLRAGPAYNHRRVWLVFGLGFMVGALTRIVDPFPELTWMNVYISVTSGVMWGLICLGAHEGLTGKPLLALAEQRGLRISLFDLSFMQPVARNSLLVALVFIGGITVSLFFLPLQTLLRPINLVFYIAVAAVVVWIFFTSMQGTHRALASAKKRELDYARRRLTAAYQRLQAQSPGAGEGEPGPAAAEVSLWLALEQRLLAVPEWPYDTRTLRNLGVAILAPILSVLARLVAERLF
jgi:hypothetical protein